MERALSFPRDSSGREVCIAPEFRPGHRCLLPSLWVKSGEKSFNASPVGLHETASEISSAISQQPKENT